VVQTYLAYSCQIGASENDMIKNERLQSTLMFTHDEDAQCMNDSI
jgi:hypothetical protein